MITDEGKMHIKRYLAGAEPSIGLSIGLGVSEKAESATDTTMGFEVSRVNVNLTTYDFLSDRLVFKARVPEDYDGYVYEVALFSSVASADGGGMITSFDSDTELWVDSSTLISEEDFTDINVRVGSDALQHLPAANATKTSSLLNIETDLSNLGNSDAILLALHSANTNVSEVSVMMLTDSSNFYTLNFGEPVAGFQVLSATKSQAVPTGAPDWANISEIRVGTTSKSTGASEVTLEAIRTTPMDTLVRGGTMISRSVISPFRKQNGRSQDVEYALEVTL